MDEHAAAEPLAREDRARVVRRDAVERAAQRRVERQVLVGLQHQRIEVEHAELAVARPRLGRPQPLERADVDEHGRGAAELHVVGRRVLERQVRASARRLSSSCSSAASLSIANGHSYG